MVFNQVNTVNVFMIFELIYKEATTVNMVVQTINVANIQT